MAADLSRITANCDANWYALEMVFGRLSGVGIYQGGRRVASACYRIEDDEFVLVAGGGRADFNITEATLPMFERLAFFSGCKSIRFHTNRRGLVAKTEKSMGWKLSEYVMRKAVSYGR